MIYFLSGWRVSTIKRIAKIGTRVLLICALLFGITAGINWLSHQPWGSGGYSYNEYVCTQHGTLVTKTLSNGDILLSCK